MLTRPQQIMLKRAQQQAGLADAEYREGIALCTGMSDCRSSTDRRLTDAHLDALMAFFEAIYWVGVEAGTLPSPKDEKAVFRQRGWWANRNKRGNTTRDRFTERDLDAQIATAEAALGKLGYGPGYCTRIRQNIPQCTEWKYLGALNRTLKSKQAKLTPPPISPSATEPEGDPDWNV